MNRNILNILLYTIAASVLFIFLLPNYNSTGYNVLGLKGLVYKWEENKKLINSLKVANDLYKSSDSNLSGYSSIPQEYMDKINTALPKEKDMARNINDIDALAKSKDIVVSEFKFSRNLNDAKKKTYNTHEISFSAAGDYKDFKEFLLSLEKSLEIHNVKSVSVSQNQDNVSGFKMKYSITLETYQVKNNTK
jgi:Tfp pilus assembly protein PilO